MYETTTQQEDSTANIPEQMVNRDITEKMLQGFSMEEKQLLYLKCGCGIPYKDVARLMGISEDAAKKRGTRLIQRIRSAMEQRGDEQKGR